MDQSLIIQAQHRPSTHLFSVTRDFRSEDHKANALQGQANKDSNVHGEKTLCDRASSALGGVLDSLYTKIYNFVTGKPTPLQLQAFRLGLIEKINEHSGQVGIYRESGRAEVSNDLMRRQFDPLPENLNGNDAVTTLKASLGDQSTTLFPNGAAFEKTAHLFEEKKTADGKTEYALKEDVTREDVLDALEDGLSEDEKVLFSALLDSLGKVSKQSDTNLMTPSNIAIGFGSTLFPEDKTPIDYQNLSAGEVAQKMAEGGSYTPKRVALFETLLQQPKPKSAEELVSPEFAALYDSFDVE